MRCESIRFLDGGQDVGSRLDTFDALARRCTRAHHLAVSRIAPGGRLFRSASSITPFQLRRIVTDRIQRVCGTDAIYNDEDYYSLIIVGKGAFPTGPTSISLSPFHRTVPLNQDLTVALQPFELVTQVEAADGTPIDQRVRVAPAIAVRGARANCCSAAFSEPAAAASVWWPPVRLRGLPASFVVLDDLLALFDLDDLLALFDAGMRMALLHRKWLSSARSLDSCAWVQVPSTHALVEPA